MPTVCLLYALNRFLIVHIEYFLLHIVIQCIFNKAQNHIDFVLNMKTVSKNIKI